MDGEVLAQTIDVIDLVGVLANALLGGVVARAHRLDPVGFAVLAVLSGLGVLPSLLLGVITAVGGGAVRDIAMGSIPKVLASGTPLYATPALVAAGVQAAFQAAGSPGIGMPVATLVGAAVYLLARWRGWTLPERIEWTAMPVGRAARKANDRDE